MYGVVDLRKKLFFIPYLVKHGNSILHSDYFPVGITVHTYTYIHKLYLFWNLKVAKIEANFPRKK